ncbi:MAG: ImmA/IrrE family metallo-endopeptidase [Thermodesulfobacteriota bacterium]
MADKELAFRLKAARESLGINLMEASRRLGFPHYQTLSNIEAGEREVKVSELAKFAKVYFISVSKLLGQTDDKSTYTFLWRNPPQFEEMKKETEAEIFYRCEQYHLLENLLKLKRKRGFLDVSIEDIRTNHGINDIASEYRMLLGLGNRPAFTLQKALEQDYAVKILFYSLPEGSSASTIHSDFGGVIVINLDEAPWRRKYDLAHELFHLITWNAVPFEDLKDESFFKDIEKKADKFASMLLLPENEVRKEIGNRLEAQEHLAYSDLVDIAINFGVSTVALLYRLAYLGFIDWETADKVAKDEELSELSRQKRKYERWEQPVSERFHSLAIRCLRKGLISRGKFAEIVGIDRSEIDDFIDDTGLMESEGTPIEIVAR